MNPQDPLRLAEKYKPRSLSEVVGQGAVKYLKDLAANPRPCCVCLLGDTGTGKSASADCFLQEIGCYQESGWNSAYIEAGPDFDISTARHYFGPETPFRYVAAGGWHVLLIEELEWLHPTVQTFCKDALQREVHRRKLIVLATSNDLGQIKKPLRHRFKVWPFLSTNEFAIACNERLAEIWHIEAPEEPLPENYRRFGWDEGTFSMRLALDRLEDALLRSKMEVAV